MAELAEIAETDEMDGDGAIAIVGMAGRFPGARGTSTAFWRNLREGVEAISLLHRRGARGGRRRRRRASRDPALRQGAGDARGRRALRRRLLRLQPPRGGDHRLRSTGSSSSAPGRRWRTPATIRPVSRGDRGLCRRQLQPLSAHALRPSGDPAPAGRLPGAPRQREGLPADPDLLQARPARARASPCRPPARPRWSPSISPARACSTASATWRSPAGVSIRYLPEARLPLPGGRNPLARRPLPGLRRRGAGHGRRQRRRRGRAEAAGGRARRRRPHPRRDPRLGDQQRRLGEGRLHGPERRRAVAGDRGGAGDRRCRARDRPLRRGARHRHPAGRPDRDRRPDPGFPRPHRGAAASAPWARSRPTSATWTPRPASPA